MSATAKAVAAAGQFGGEIGGLYRRWVLDCVVEYAYAVSMDFNVRPGFYKNVSVVDELLVMQVGYGNHA
jgi:hypothetical protein